MKETPCLECPRMPYCNKMCYKRLEWAMFDARKDDEELSTYGMNCSVKGEKRVIKDKKKILLKCLQNGRLSKEDLRYFLPNKEIESLCIGIKN